MQKILVSLVVIVALCFILRAAIDKYSANRSAVGLQQNEQGMPALDGCDGLLNCTASTASNKKHLVEPLTYTSPAVEVISKLGNLISQQPGANIVTTEPYYLHATYRTKLLGYTDDLEVLLDQTNGVLHIRSASRLGKSDLGANRKRIEALREFVSGKI